MTDTLVHGLLIGGDVVATIVVGWGILWEAPAQPEHRHRIAQKLVIVGILAETLCSIILFRFDESISQTQQEKIIALESRIKARSLAPAERKEISGRVGRFVGQSFEIDPYSEDRESVDFGEEISSALVDASWSRVIPPKPIWILSVVAGLVVYVHDDAPTSTKDAARALVDILNEKNIDAALKTHHDDSPIAQINVTVGIKP